MSNLLKDASILLTPTGYDNGSMNSIKPTDGDGDFTFVRGTAATRVNAQGLVEEVTDTNLPRINYEDFSYDGNGDIIPNSGCGSWLLEPQSTNLITYSEDFSQWSLISGGSRVPNSVISPDGTQNASSWITNAIGQRIQRTTGGFTQGNTYTFSIYIRADTNLNVGIGGIQSNVISVAVTTEWQRFEVTQNASGTTRYPQLQNIGNNGTFYIWGAQVEEQSFATSYIPTSGATNTRNQDIATNSGNSTLINSTEGVLYAEIAAFADDTINNRITLSYDYQNYVRIAVTNSQIAFSVFNNGAYQANGNYVVSDITDFNKVAFKYKENDFALWINGVEVRTDTSGLTSFSSPLDHLNFSNANGNNQIFKGKNKCLAVYKEALTDAELQCLTTI